MIDMALDHADAVAGHIRPPRAQRGGDGERECEAWHRTPADEGVGDDEDDKARAEEQEAADLIGRGELRDQVALEDHADDADDYRHEDEGPPVAETKPVEQHPGDEGAHHVLGAVGEVDDVEEPEDDCEPETQDGVERAVDQPEQQLPEQGLRGDSEKLEHRRPLKRTSRSSRTARRADPGPTARAEPWVPALRFAPAGTTGRYYALTTS